jgi:hypothetical protein
MGFLDWLLVLDVVALGVAGAGYVWLGSVAWADLKRKPPVRRDAGHYGTQGGDL